MERDSDSSTHLPPGFRFHPSDEELIVHYLRNKATSRPLPSSNIIADVDLYKCDPWELPKKAFFGDDEWYFFTLRDRKYPNGVRPNRMAASGYWKATGTDKQIFNKCKSVIIGVKKSLVFYNGHPSKSVKTDWIMQEYRLPETVLLTSQSNGSMKLDDWVLCRVQQKRCNSKGTSSVIYGSSDELPCAYNQNTYYTNVPTANLEMIQDFISRECLVLPLILSTHTSLPTVEISKTIFEDCRSSTSSIPKEDRIREYSQYLLPPLSGHFNMKKRGNYEDPQLDRATEIKRHFSNGNEKNEVIPSISNTDNDEDSIEQFDGSNNTVYQFQLMTKYQDLSHFTF